MHAYPAQLADFVLDNWPARAPLGLSLRSLRELLSTSFQASLIQEEGRNVRFRCVLASPQQLPSSRESSSWSTMSLVEPLSFTPDEARRLSPAAPFQSTAMGIVCEGVKASIWGLIQTGPGWLGPSWGGRSLGVGSHNFLLLQVLAPGRLVVYCGKQLIASLERGSIEASTTDVFTSKWLPRLFQKARKEAQTEAEQRVAKAVRFDESLLGTISQHMIRRAIFMIRSESHGGLLLFVESDIARACAAGVGPLSFKYAIEDGSDRNRFRNLLGELLGELSHEVQSGVVGWEQFSRATNPKLEAIEESIFDFSGLVAGLSSVDGAVVLDKRFSVMGFGAEVAGGLHYPETVYQALDLEAERMIPEPASAVGTRHRAAYRFVMACPSGLAIVVSHDGAVRFVANLDGQVVYWEQFLNW